MADRSFYKNVGTLERALVLLAGKWAIGASGAVGAKTAGTGLGTLSRTSAGLYSLVLDDVYPALLAWKVGATTAAGVDLCAEVVSYVAATKTLTFQFKTATVATDPASSSELSVFLVLSNASSTPIA